MKMPRALLSLLVLLALLVSLVSCDRGQKPDDGTLVGEAASLIRASVVLDRLFFVEGLPALSAEEGEGYVSVNTAALSSLGFTSYASIRAYAEQIYSYALFSSFESMAVLAVTDGSVLIRRAYCYDKTDKKGNFQDFLVSTAGLHKQMDRAEYDLSTLTVTKKTASTARLTVEATVTSHDTGETQRRPVTVAPCLADGIWKLDTLTCLTFLRDSYPPLS